MNDTSYNIIKKHILKTTKELTRFLSEKGKAELAGATSIALSHLDLLYKASQKSAPKQTSLIGGSNE